MRVVFAGTPEPAVAALQAILASRHELVGVVTRPDAPAGRGRKLVASPVAQYAEELGGIEILKPVKPSDPDFLARLAEIAPDCCPVVAYGGLLPQAALDIPRHGWINLHFSVLPAWRGAAPVQHSIIAGDDVTGASTFQIVKALDAGPVYGVHRADRSFGHLGGLLEPARGLRREAPGGHAGRRRGRRTRGTATVGRGSDTLPLLVQFVLSCVRVELAPRLSWVRMDQVDLQLRELARPGAAEENFESATQAAPFRHARQAPSPPSSKRPRRASGGRTRLQGVRGSAPPPAVRNGAPSS